jgi:hypothetical protein
MNCPYRIQPNPLSLKKRGESESIGCNKKRPRLTPGLLVNLLF